VQQKLPAVLGSNIAGIVEAVGEDVTICKAGDEVFGVSYIQAADSDQAGLQQYAVLNADALCKIPEGFYYEQVVTLPTNLVTSAIALFTGPEGFGIPAPFSRDSEHFDYRSISLVIIGGGTNVGKLAVQLARIAGVGRIIVIAGVLNSDQLKSMGATHVINRSNSPKDIAKKVQSITGADGASYVYDCANTQFDLAAALLSSNKPSRLRTLLPIQGEEVEKLKAARPECDAAFIGASNAVLVSQVGGFWAQVPMWLQNGKILPTAYHVVDGLENVKELNEALDAYRDGARAGPQSVVRI
jgi:NADPH:quinone reductase